MFVNRVCLTLVLLQILINYHYFPIFHNQNCGTQFFRPIQIDKYPWQPQAAPEIMGTMNSEFMGQLKTQW